MKHVGTKAFETERLVCRRFRPEDCEDIFRNWAANPHIQLEYGEPVYAEISQVRDLLAGYVEGYRRPDFYRWAIVERASGENIGQIAFCRVYSDCRTAEIEYCIGEPFWGNGYAGEALAGLIDFAFENADFVRLEAYHRRENGKSGRVLEKAAMRIADTVERFAREGKLPEGEVCYCIDRDAYMSLKRSGA
ncbi:MAG: GNAT family N-acetyltransferase [Clostridia bacterium]|nr:GNAT family N-acetyltransferase [Clostridia bacterium]